jgi:hypothetical protein
LYVTRVISAGMAVLLVVAFLPAYAPAQEASKSSPGQTEYVPGETEEEIVGGLRLAKGKHGRRMWRATRWVDQLSGDRARVFDSYGMPSSRYREETLGRVEETWTYLDQGIQITFQGDSVVRTRRITPGTR